MKSITQERLIATFEKISGFCERFTKRESAVSMALFRFGFKSLVSAQFSESADAQKEREALILLLTTTFHDVFTLEDAEKLHLEFVRKVDYVHQKRDRVRKIQEKHQVSGLRRDVCLAGGTAIDRWRLAHDHLEILDSDLELLKPDRSKVFRFWVDTAQANGLQSYQRTPDGSQWMKVSFEFCSLVANEYEWADVWEDLQWIEPAGYVPLGYAVSLNTSRTPADGYEKHHEIHLSLGKGKDWEGGEGMMCFCACNEVPFS